MVINLSSIYQSIALKAFDKDVKWPASSDFVQSLDRIDFSNKSEPSIVGGKYKATTFVDNQGPFGIMALFNKHHNSHAVPFVNEMMTFF
jgi:hypothetical protein